MRSMKTLRGRFLFYHLNSSFTARMNLLSSQTEKSFSARSISEETAKKTNCNYCDKGDLLEVMCNGSRVTLSYIWLRDHCQSGRYYNQATFQRRNDRIDFPLDIRPKNILFERDTLRLEWEDDHVTTYDVEWLFRNGYNQDSKNKVEKFLWDRDTINSYPLPVVKYDKYMKTEDGLREHLENILKIGFSIVSEVDASVEGFQEVAERTCCIKETLFGKTEIITSDPSIRDTGFTNEALRPHTDNTYFKDAAGIQMFQCIEHTGTGGVTLLVDGFQVAEAFRSSHPEEFAYLSKRVIPQEMKGFSSSHCMWFDKVISLNPVTNEIAQIRFNVYDRAPLNTIPPEEHKTFYDAYSKFSEEIFNPVNEFLYKLTPGNVIFIDNFRVLHGRTAFTGKRSLCNGYLPRDEWMGKARFLNLI